MATVQTSEQMVILEADKSLYFNGFGIAVGLGDIPITISRNGIPVLTLNCSYSVAKTLAVALSECIANFEKAAKHDIMTVQQVQAALESVSQIQP